jgi:hypothetical protein
MYTLEPINEDKNNDSRFNLKAAESQWRGMKAQDRQVFSAKHSKPKRIIKINLWHIFIAILLAVGVVGLATTPSCPIIGMTCHD